MTASTRSGVSFSLASAASPSTSPTTSPSPLNSATASLSGSPRTTSRTKAPATKALMKVLVKILVRRAKAPMNLREVYRAYGEDSEMGARACQLLEQQHWYSSIAEFDPKTGAALPLGFDAVLRRQARLHPQANGAETI